MRCIERIEVNSTYEREIWAFREELLEYDRDDKNQFAGCRGLCESSSADAWVSLCNLLRKINKLNLTHVNSN